MRIRNSTRVGKTTPNRISSDETGGVLRPRFALSLSTVFFVTTLGSINPVVRAQASADAQIYINGPAGYFNFFNVSINGDGTYAQTPLDLGVMPAGTYSVALDFVAEDDTGGIAPIPVASRGTQTQNFGIVFGITLPFAPNGPVTSSAGGGTVSAQADAYGTYASGNPSASAGADSQFAAAGGTVFTYASGLTLMVGAGGGVGRTFDTTQTPSIVGHANVQMSGTAAASFSTSGSSVYINAPAFRHGTQGIGSLGDAQNEPLLPTSIDTTPSGGTRFTFSKVASGQWFDPPSASSFAYTMTSGSLFTKIDDFPTGFDNPFTISTNGIVLGTFGPGQSVDMTGFPGGGVSTFTVSGISPLVDPNDPLGFALPIEFNTPTASFEQEAVSAPEPSSIVLIAAGGLIACTRRRSDCRRRRGEFQTRL